MGSPAGMARRQLSGTMSQRVADPESVVSLYLELRNLRKTGERFGITRERVRQIVNRAGYSTAPRDKPRSPKPQRLCPVCGEPVTAKYAVYCEPHRRDAGKRRYQALKADPVRYARWRERLRINDRQRRERRRDEARR